MSTGAGPAGASGRADSPTVSVVIPVRDDAIALDACLRRLARQTRPPTQVLVVDNGSTDTSAQVAQRWGAEVVVEPRPGIPRAAATGYDAAAGEVLLRLDADSLPSPTWVEHGLRLLDQPDVVAASGWGRFDLPGWTGHVVADTYLGAYYGLGHLAAGHPVLWGSCMAIRRSTWERVRPVVARAADVHDDFDLALALDPCARVVVDRSWRVTVSARSVRPGQQWRVRWRRAGTTLAGQWRRLPPWRRWQARLART